MASLLVIDEDGGCRSQLADLLRDVPDLRMQHFSRAGPALASLTDGSIDAVLACAQLPDATASDVVQRLRPRRPSIPVIVLTTHGQEPQTYDALKRGAAGYVARANLATQLKEVVTEVLATVHAERRHQDVMRCLVESRSHFVLGNDPTLVPALVEHIDQDLTELGMTDETRRMRIGVAIQEAVMNAIVHGNLEIGSETRTDDMSRYNQLLAERRRTPPYRDRVVHIVTHETPSTATYTVRDAGPGFDLCAVPDCTDPANLERPCGRGLMIIRSFMDEVRFSDRGNEVTMVARIGNDLRGRA